ncbi:MAG: SOS response-associated peptidase [Proteobacteria bacterium]|nr:SOS response-associated peptidase [Pseudomonadota bacterium]MBU4009562.1 SOS response-associated peptidase [Pseudomonadota bacterium]MBU4035812.1 SOS response-associated peptidase [Pseudomonadota bacterium]
MCGRFAQFSPLNILRQKFKIDDASCDFTASYNVAPTQEVLVIVKRDNKNYLEKQHWGLVPHWAKDGSTGFRMINARMETIATKPAFREAFKKRRCLVIADGFYEWKGEKGRKQPYFISITSGEPFAFAGLWDTWNKKTGDKETAYKSCTIITTTASKSVAELHDRMPVIFLPKYQELWLNPELQSSNDLEAILHDGITSNMKYYQVSKQVNLVKNNNPTCVVPLILPSCHRNI